MPIQNAKFWKKIGRLEKVCLSKQRQSVTIINSVHPVRNTLNVPKLKQNLNILKQATEFEVETF